MTGPNKTHSIARGDIAGVMRGFARTMAAAKPQSLTPGELGHSNVRHLADPPLPVLAWVRYGPTGVRVAGYMPEWTDRACRVTWTTPTGEEHASWVWSGAVTERREEPATRWTTPAEHGAALNEIAARSL